jgi:FeS assembly SUF system regulator
MLRISRLTDYGTMILVHLATHARTHADGPCPASDVAIGTRVALPTVQKLLKTLARAELVSSARGAEGGYRLARPAAAISAAEILDALEGPLSLTECSTADSHCELENGCPTGSAWQKLNRAIRGALHDVSLAELAHPPREFTLNDLTGRGPRPRHRPLAAGKDGL